MNREIKFRAWDSRRSRMMQPFITLEKSVDGLIVESTNWHDEEDMKNEWDTSNQANELMQFTGLHDKNGKEIYEGDIVQWWYGDHVGPLTSPIRFDSHRASFDVPAHSDGTPRELEVIGNVYESPELIDASTLK